MLFGFFAVPVVPGEYVAGNKAGKDIITTNETTDSYDADLDLLAGVHYSRASIPTAIATERTVKLL
jgi:hypothetical protein